MNLTRRTRGETLRYHPEQHAPEVQSVCTVLRGAHWISSIPLRGRTRKSTLHARNKALSPEATGVEYAPCIHQDPLCKLSRNVIVKSGRQCSQ